MNDTIFVGIIQTSLNYQAAWTKGASWQECVRISHLEEQRAKKEIRHYLASLKSLPRRPDIILLPELSVPIGFERALKNSAESVEAIIIAGLDYCIETSIKTPTVSNEVTVIVPRKLGGKRILPRTEVRRVGKTYPAPAEMKRLEEIQGGGVKFLPRPAIWLFESDDFGSFAVAVCYDFMDLDRIVMYRRKIQTLFILAYNRDTTSFDHLAEAIARMVFCNVVVCNCGHFGGSLAVSPFRESFDRTVYRHSGQRLPNAQLIELPLANLKAHQEGSSETQEMFKSLPPGFSDLYLLKKKVEKIP